MLLDWNNNPIGPTEKSVNPCVDLFGPGPDGVQCKECIHLHYYHQSARWYKCDQKPKHMRGISGDHKVRWPVCKRYEKRKEDE